LPEIIVVLQRMRCCVWHKTAAQKVLQRFLRGTKQNFQHFLRGTKQLHRKCCSACAAAFCAAVLQLFVLLFCAAAALFRAAAHAQLRGTKQLLACPRFTTADSRCSMSLLY
jgi:hypothetical protein